MEINIGDNSKRDERALTVYEAFSDADEKYVKEMLSDAAAARIREANRKKSFRIKSSVAAIAAVFALVIGLNVIPHGKMTKDNGGSSNFIAADAPREKAEHAAAPEMNNEAKSDEAPQAVQENAAAAADDDKTPPPPGYAEEAEAAENIGGTEDVDEAKTTPDGGAMHTIDGTVKNEQKTDDVAGLQQEESADRGDSKGDFGAGEYVELGNGAAYYVGEELGTDKYCGAAIADGATADGKTKACEFKGFDPDYLVVLKHGGRLYAAITADFKRRNFSEITEGLHFEEYLMIDGQECLDGSIQKLDDNTMDGIRQAFFTKSNAEKFVLSDETPIMGYYKLICRLGTEDKTFVQPLVVEVSQDRAAITCMNGYGYYVDR